MKTPQRRNKTELLPWYVTGTLPEEERPAVDEQLQGQPDARAELTSLRRLQQVLNSRPSVAPSAETTRRILQHASSAANRPQPAAALRWTAFTSLSLSILILLWMLVQPGVMLEWAGSTSALQEYRIYRAPLGSDAYVLLQEITALPERSAYSFVDALLLPGQNYQYRIEAVPAYGPEVVSQAVVGRALDVLPAQLTLVLVSLLAGYVVVKIAASSPRNQRGVMPEGVG